MSDLPDFAGAAPDRPAAVTIGVFDGVHRGHLGLLAQLRSAAAARELATAVVTFKNHPLTVLRPEVDVTYLMPFERRLALLEAADVDHVVPIDFTHEISQLTAREFVTALRDRLSMRHLVAGPDFALGKGRAGPPGQERGQKENDWYHGETSRAHRGCGQRRVPRDVEGHPRTCSSRQFKSCRRRLEET